MATDKDVLTQLNIDIGHSEARGDREWLNKRIAPHLAFRRADETTIDNRALFLNKVYFLGLLGKVRLARHCATPLTATR